MIVYTTARLRTDGTLTWCGTFVVDRGERRDEGWRCRHPHPNSDVAKRCATRTLERALARAVLADAQGVSRATTDPDQRHAG